MSSVIDFCEFITITGRNSSIKIFLFRVMAVVVGNYAETPWEGV